MTHTSPSTPPDTIRRCPLCGSSQSRHFEHLKHPVMPMEYRICSDCSYVFQAHAWEEEKLQAYYSEQYRVQMEQSDRPTDRVRAIENARARLLTEKLAASGVVPNRHLDIGCSTGAFLLECSNKFGCQPTGVEPGNSYRQFAQERGLEVVPSIDAIAVDTPDRFDLVSLIHVVEHLADPVTTLVRVRETLLAQNGWLLVEVPNLYAHDSLEPAHVSAFSPHTLEQLLLKTGYRVMRTWMHGQPRSEILQLYITMLAKPVKPASTQVQAEQLVQFRRKICLFQRRVLQRLMPSRAWLPYPPLDE